MTHPPCCADRERKELALTHIGYVGLHILLVAWHGWSFLIPNRSVYVFTVLHKCAADLRPDELRRAVVTLERAPFKHSMQPLRVFPERLDFVEHSL